LQQFDEAYFAEYGFETLPEGTSIHLAYGLEEELYAYQRERTSVLFSIVDRTNEGVELAVTPSLLDMPVEPPFLFTLNDPVDIRNLFEAHARTADALDFPHTRVAQYLALRHLNRKYGEPVADELIAFLTGSDWDYSRKLTAIINS